MSIPLDRLYHYIESIAQEIRKDNVVIYHFYPHGSKKVNDLLPLREYFHLDFYITPHLYCNDQEPLDYAAYPNLCRMLPKHKQLLESFNIPLPPDTNFSEKLNNIYDYGLLLHSEQHSSNLQQYKNNNFIPVYYWSHAVIALDWFRYANHVKQNKKVNKTFLIYNRAWSGTREYRFGFTDRVIQNNMVEHCLMRISPIDSTVDKHYDLHQFEHPEWRPTNVIEKYFPICKADSTYSADFDLTDYETTDIEIVLETLFDDQRIYLTEKILRPIAVGQPFILAGTPNSLKYLRSYGFKTFSDCWDESYDMMTDSIERMNKITDIMKNISCMSSAKREKMLVRAHAIADHNKQYFFSNEFQNLIINELKQNLNLAFEELESRNTSKLFFNWRKNLAKNSNTKPFLFEHLQDVPHGRHYLIEILKKARQYYLRTLSQD
jgi:hypothetical protein